MTSSKIARASVSKRRPTLQSPRGDAMKLGVGLPVAGAWGTPDNLIRIAQRAETLGYHSLWVFQRLLYALAPKNDYPPAPGQPWPKAFERVLDPIVTLAYVAAATRRIRLGTSILIMPYYTPIVLAKQLTTLDILSGGRLNVGLGVGWSEDEYDAVGVPFRHRGKRADEFLRCLRTIWTDDVVEFRGEFYRVPRAKVEPKPVQKPHPPITVGGYGPAMIRRAVTLADGFSGGNVPLAEVAPLVSQIKAAAVVAARAKSLDTIRAMPSSARRRASRSACSRARPMSPASSASRDLPGRHRVGCATARICVPWRGSVSPPR